MFLYLILLLRYYTMIYLVINLPVVLKTVTGNFYCTKMEKEIVGHFVVIVHPARDRKNK